MKGFLYTLGILLCFICLPVGLFFILIAYLTIDNKKKNIPIAPIIPIKEKKQIVYKEVKKEGLQIKCNIDKTICIEDYDITLNLNKEKDMQTFLSILDCEFEQERNKYAQELSDKLKNAKTAEDFDDVNKQIDKWQRMRG